MGICNDRVVIVTGAGGGLGAAHARVFAREGASVIVNDINEAAAQSVVDEIVAAGGKAAVNTSDITNYDDSLNAVIAARRYIHSHVDVDRCRTGWFPGFVLWCSGCYLIKPDRNQVLQSF